MKVSIKTVLSYIAVSIIFTSSWTVTVVSFAEGKVSYLIMAILMMLWLQYFKGIYLNKPFFVIFGVISIVSLYNVLTGNNVIGLFAKQFFGIFSSAIFFYMLLKVNDYDVKKLFNIYMNIAFVVAFIGVFQEVSYVLRFKPGYYFGSLLQSWRMSYFDGGKLVRVNSILSEASLFCDVMAPAFFASIASFVGDRTGFQKRWKGLIIIFSFFLSFSASGYAAAFFALALLLYNYLRSRYFIVGVMVVCGLLFISYKNIAEFGTRVDQTVKVFIKKQKLETASSTSYALISNLLVSYENFKDNALFGTGIGSHPVIYFKYIKDIVNPDELVGFGPDCKFMNIKDANSLFSRMLSETGLFGISIFFIFIIKHYVSRREDGDGYLWIISNAALSMFFIKLLRVGHYFTDGFFFFIWAYYFAKLQARRSFFHEQRETQLKLKLLQNRPLARMNTD